MVNLFFNILSMSLTASYCIILICIARLFLRKCPKIFSYLLWGIIAIRLVCPVGMESSFSFISRPVKNLSDFLAADNAGQMSKLPDNDNALPVDVPVIFGHLPALSSEELSTSELLSNLGEELVAGSYTSTNVNAGIHTGFSWKPKSIVSIIAYVWFAGVLALLTYNIFSYWKIRTRLNKSAVYDSLYKNIPVYTMEGLETPFVLGIRRVVIFLPRTLAGKEREYCIAHEYAHICRRDYLIKQCAFLFVCIYWFNPFIWLAFHLMTKDMEMSCDEIVLKNVTLQERKIYSKILLQSACKNYRLMGAIPSFGRDYVPSRIRNILKLRKRSSGIMLFSMIFILICAAGMLTDPVNMNMALSKFVSHAASENGDIHTVRGITDFGISDLKQAKESAITAEILEKPNLYARVVLADNEDTDTKAIIDGKAIIDERNIIEVFAKPIHSSTETVGTIAVGDKVQILSIGCDIMLDVVTYGDFPDINKASASIDCMDYVMVLFEDAEGVQKRGYVRKNNLSLVAEDNTIDAYAYWTAKVWASYFCTKNFTLMSYLTALNDEEYENYIHHSEAFVYTDNPRKYPLNGYYIAMEQETAKIYYFEENAKPAVYVWQQDIVIETDKLQEVSRIDDLLFGGLVRSSPEKRYGGQISTYEEFKETYVSARGFYCFADYNYENEIFQFHASRRKDMTFKEPEYALRHYLHLNEDVLVEELEAVEAGMDMEKANRGYDAYAKVKCTFTDEVTLIFPMYQSRGIWYIDRKGL